MTILKLENVFKGFKPPARLANYRSGELAILEEKLKSAKAFLSTKLHINENKSYNNMWSKLRVTLAFS